MALDTTGIHADCTPRMAWNYYFGDKEAFYAERFTQIRAKNSFSEAHLASTRHLKRAAPEEAQNTPIRPSKRAAAEKASSAWTGLLQRKGKRHN